MFSVSDGPKVINESLNTYGSDGWYLSTMITVGGGEHLVAWMVKPNLIVAPNPAEAQAKKLANLWTGESEKNERPSPRHRNKKLLS